MSRIASRRIDLGRRHYVLNGRTGNHWVGITPSKVQHYRARFGDDFTIIVNGSDVMDDAYILPYSLLKFILAQATPESFRRRWMLRIVNGELRLPGCTFPAARFHNAFELLDLFGGPSDAIAA